MTGVLGLMGAIESEVTVLRDGLQGAVTRQVLGLEVVTGRLSGADVALVRCGVGKVNAALGAAALATVGARAVLFTGVAGGLGADVAIGDLVVATDLVQHDVDVTALGRRPGELLGEPAAWPADEHLRALCLTAAEHLPQRPRVHEGRIASGDQFIASPEQRARITGEFAALAAEMEGAAMAQACTRIGLPFAVVRSISDTADGTAVEDFPAFLHRAGALGADLCRHVAAAWAADRPAGSVGA